MCLCGISLAQVTKLKSYDHIQIARVGLNSHQKNTTSLTLVHAQTAMNLERMKNTCSLNAAQRNILMAHLQQLLPHHTDLLDHLKNKSNRKNLVARLVIGTKG